MSNDGRFDGKRIYKVNSAGTAVYDIRGNHIHEPGSAGQAKYEIQGNHIRQFMSASHEYMSAGPAIYDIR